MRKLIASTFTSLDGVMQAPGGPEEDTTQNFSLGGWVFAYGDPEADISEAGFDGKDRELVLGRRTYEIFEAYWPYQSKDHPIAKTFNAVKKHVATRTLKSLQWNNSSVLGDDVVSAIKALKSQPGDDLQIIGSGNLIQTLQAASLIDLYNVWTYPIVLGHGKRLFEHGARPTALRLVNSKTSKTGILMNTYAAAGDIEIASIDSSEPSAEERARRSKIAAGTW